MAFSIGLNTSSCQNQRNAHRMSGNSALRVMHVRQMQPKRSISTITAFRETGTSETATPASTKQLTVSLKLSVSYLIRSLLQHWSNTR